MWQRIVTPRLKHRAATTPIWCSWRREFTPNSRMAAVWIVAAAACHYFGFEFIRAASVTLFTVEFGPSMLPVALLMVPALAAGFLAWYRVSLIRDGPYKTLMSSTIICAAGLLIAAVGTASPLYWLRCVSVWFMHIHRSAYVSWLQSQYWSRLTSCLPKKEAKTLFGPILGATSLFATLGGLCVGPVARSYGELGSCLLCAGSLVLSLAFIQLSFRAGGDMEYDRSSQQAHGVHATSKPTEELTTWQRTKRFAKGCASGDAVGWSSLQASPILPRLFVCTMTMQILATCIALMFQNYLVEAYAVASDRSAFMGRFFASAKGISAVLQFSGVPLLFRQVPLTTILGAMPVAVLGAVVVMVVMPSLWVAALLLLIFKVTEYTMYSAAREMLYMPLSFEARYMAKEVIDVFGYRVGRAGTALLVSVVLPMVTPTAATYMWLAFCSSAAWSWSVVQLRAAALAEEAAQSARQRSLGSVPEGAPMLGDEEAGEGEGEAGDGSDGVDAVVSHSSPKRLQAQSV